MSFLGRRRPEAAPDASTLVADSRAWRFLPGIGKVDARRGTVSLDADVEDDLPLVDLDATGSHSRSSRCLSPARWLASVGVTYARASDGQTRRAAPGRAALTLLAPRTDGVDPTPLHRVRYNSSKKGFGWRARRGPSEAEGGARHAALIWADLESW